MKFIKLILVLIVFFISLFLYKNIFKIKTVDIQSEKVDCADNLQIKNSTNFLGQNIFLTNKNSVELDFKKKFICIKEINLSKKIPGKIILKILGREAKATVYEASPSAQATPSGFLVDDEGVIFSKDSNSELNPKIFIENSNLSLGKNLPVIKQVLLALDKIGKFGLDNKISQILNNSLIIFSSPKIVFQLDDKIDSQIASLQLILEKAKINRRTIPTDVGMDSEIFEFIDLRFDKPVIKIAPKNSYGQR